MPYKNKEDYKLWCKKRRSSGYWKSKEYKEKRKNYLKIHPDKRKWFKRGLKDFVFEILSMVENGNIAVGPFGLSQNSLDYAIKLHDKIK